LNDENMETSMEMVSFELQVTEGHTSRKERL
jgi:hypothetical protein